jgi:endonuclease G, mitochondrial
MEARRRAKGGTMESYGQERAKQQEAAAHRVGERTRERVEHEHALARPGGIGVADSPERIAKRLDRLSRYYAGDAPPPSAAAAPDVLVQEALARVGNLVEGDREPGTVLEKIINTPDFVDIRFLDAGVAAARAVGRVNIRDAGGRLEGYGTGSLVSPRLLLTNHHVLPDPDAARSSIIEFNYQDGLDGKPLQPLVFPFDPDTFFLADRERDFALVAVRAAPGELAPFGYNQLIEAEGKAIIGEFVTIVQHPRGEKKQVALRENKIVDIPELVLHYAADTEPGSSGSPVFNDQWEVVGLHHASVPAPAHDELGGFMNEGIRVSRIMRFLHDQALAPAQRSLVDGVFAPEHIEVPGGAGAPVAVAPPAAVARVGSGPAEAIAAAAGGAVALAALPVVVPGDAVTLTVPLSITLRLGDSGGNGSGNGSGGPVTLPPEAPVAPPEAPVAPPEAPVAPPDAPVAPPDAPVAPPDAPVAPPDAPVAPPDAPVVPPDAPDAPSGPPLASDPRYADRGGFDAAFLGAPLPLPVPAPELAPVVSPELRYHHFSVVMHRARKLALITAVNIDGRQPRPPRRGSDHWILDPRLPAEDQTGEAVYDDNPLDRGHLVRRLDPAWGATDAIALAANDDTFHFTNCSPQHHLFNAGSTLWAGLEDYVLRSADTADLAVSVFTGPVLAADDDEYRGIQLPRQFWKIVGMVTKSGRLSVTGYLLSQASLLGDLESAEEFSYGAYRTYQVPVRRIADLTRLGLEPHIAADPLERLEAAPLPREIARPEDLVL